MARINTTIGDFSGNKQKVLEAIHEAKSLGIDLLTFLKLAICGYPPEVKITPRAFVRDRRLPITYQFKEW
jgi:NAD+ synthase (glutamine-hydrolysing)